MIFFYEVRDFFAVLFGKKETRYIGFLRKPIIEHDRPNKRAKQKLGFRKY